MEGRKWQLLRAPKSEGSYTLGGAVFEEVIPCQDSPAGFLEKITASCYPGVNHWVWKIIWRDGDGHVGYTIEFGEFDADGKAHRENERKAALYDRLRGSLELPISSIDKEIADLKKAMADRS